MSPERAGSARAAWYAAIALVAVAWIGGVAGYAIGRRPGPLAQKRPNLDVSLLGSRSALSDSLGLTAAQRAAVDSLLDHAQQEADSTVDRMMIDVRAVTAKARRGVRALLDARQQVRFDSLMAATPPMRPRSPLPPRSR